MTKTSAIDSSRLNTRIDYAKYLNPNQLEAVRHTEGPLLVIAGAGSGKTRTLTYRVAYLVEQGIAPSSILLLTFTRKAAHEMLRRASRLLDHRCTQVAGGTFHSFANLNLRRFASRLGLTADFAILDRSDAEGLIALLRKEMDISKKARSFPRKTTLANIFSQSVNKTKSVADVVTDDYPHFIEVLPLIVEMHMAYGQRKRDHQFLDFDDLLVFFERLLREHADVCDRLAQKYRYIMVDEYQDTNKTQADILHLLTQTNPNIMVVGDDSQSIYAFRGANFKNIIEFPNWFPGTRVISLEENYRSVQPVLDLTNQIISQAREKYTKHLFTRKPGGSVPELIESEDENGQSRFVVEKIMALNRQGVPWEKMAVLFRASYHSFDLEIELSREGIDFIKYGGFKFAESAHIKDVLAHMRVIANSSDRVSWYRILMLLEKVGPATALKLFKAIQEEKAGYAGMCSLNLPKGTPAGVARLQTLYQTIDTHSLSVAELGQTVVDYYLPILKSTYDDHPKRALDLEHLVDIMQRYQRLEQFLTDMALEPPNASVDNNLDDASQTRNRLVLSTIHSAKGLEWHSVFVIWALDGRFPSMQSIYKEHELEEELRLMYVAATRAEENLFFTYPNNVYEHSLGILLNRPSRFIDMLPDDILAKQYA
jgi:DNA helicase-2/ATP-dependent DNA helicase PcrA